jgi:N-dimethylarginine dimethylaminohydrolase
MVFCANQCFPFVLSDERRAAVLSRMRWPERRGEVEFFRKFLLRRGFEIFEAPEEVPYFEGMGDALTVPGRRLVLGGCGSRTHESVYDFLSRQFGFECLKLKLVDADFYHLDTCVAVLNSETVAYVPSALENARELERFFTRRLEISAVEAKKYFAGNAFSPDGRHVLMQPGAMDFVGNLRRHGFVPVEVETGEFIKAGGSVFCLKLALP